MLYLIMYDRSSLPAQLPRVERGVHALAVPPTDAIGHCNQRIFGVIRILTALVDLIRVGLDTYGVRE
jgi:hypothetical protein